MTELPTTLEVIAVSKVEVSIDTDAFEVVEKKKPCTIGRNCDLRGCEFKE